MKIPETPKSLIDLDLMIRLRSYADRSETWKHDNEKPGERESKLCLALYTNVANIVEKALYPILDKINAREMESFTLHDHNHGLKVAHLMWHILKVERRKSLTPVEIALLILSAFIHDVGMALSPVERAKRLDPDSDLWEQIEFDGNLRERICVLKKKCEDPNENEGEKIRARQRLAQAEEAILCKDTRARHSTVDRYREILENIQNFHEQDPTNIPDLGSCLAFDGDSFLEVLINICASHGQGFEVLMERDKIRLERPRFPKIFPIGCCNADLHMVAANLRLADILDFDSERTPSMLFYYMLPGTLAADNMETIVEWRKHLSISHWEIARDFIMYRGRCSDHVVHHAIVKFAAIIEKEIIGTKATFDLDRSEWPFCIPEKVNLDIIEDGYKYVPYKFQFDDERVYGLLMGGAIYRNALMAIRELIQNAVDACKLRDSITQLYDSSIYPQTSNRITICYEESDDEKLPPKLIIKDTGTGMDKFILERYFLKVGSSYYDSPEFNRYRLELRKNNLDFAPISEFGIGFLSCFLLADRVKIETAMWDNIRGDVSKRTLVVDGPTRLIRLREESNDGPDRFKGTSITLFLTRGNPDNKGVGAPDWKQLKFFIRRYCQELPYALTLLYKSQDGEEKSIIKPLPLAISLEGELERMAIRIPVNNNEIGIEGEIVIFNIELMKKYQKKQAYAFAARIYDRDLEEYGLITYANSTLLRGGFYIGSVPGLPNTFMVKDNSRARIRLTWAHRENKRYPVPHLSRDYVSDLETIEGAIIKQWLTYLLDRVDEIPNGFLLHLQLSRASLRSFKWLEEYDAYTIYKLARKCWYSTLRRMKKEKYSDRDFADWENNGERSLYLLSFHNDLLRTLVDLVLPRVSNLQMGPEAALFVTPPVENWRDILKSWRQFITNPIPWGMFAEYIKGIDDLLFYQYPGSFHFNSKYEGILKEINPRDLFKLSQILYRIIDTERESQALVNPEELALLSNHLPKIEHLKVGSIHGKWLVRDFNIPLSRP